MAFHYTSMGGFSMDANYSLMPAGDSAARFPSAGGGTAGASPALLPPATFEMYGDASLMQPFGVLSSGGSDGAAAAASGLDRVGAGALLLPGASPAGGGGGGSGGGALGEGPEAGAPPFFLAPPLPAVYAHTMASLPAWPGPGPLPTGASPAHGSSGGLAARYTLDVGCVEDGAGTGSAPLKRLRTATQRLPAGGGGKQPRAEAQLAAAGGGGKQPRGVAAEGSSGGEGKAGSGKLGAPKKRAQQGGAAAAAAAAAAASATATAAAEEGGSEGGNSGGVTGVGAAPPGAPAPLPRAVLLSPRSSNLGIIVERYFSFREASPPPSPQLLEAPLCDTPSLAALCAAARAKWRGLMGVMAAQVAARSGAGAGGVRACLVLRAPGAGAGECEASVLFAVACGGGGSGGGGSGGGSGGSGSAAGGAEVAAHAEEFDFVALPAGVAAALGRSGALQTSGWATLQLSPHFSSGLAELASPVGASLAPGGGPATLQAAVVRGLPLDALCAAVVEAAGRAGGGRGGVAGAGGVSKWLYDISFPSSALQLSAPALLRRINGSRAATQASLQLDLTAWCLLLSEDVPGRAVALSRERAAAMVAAGVPAQLAAEALAQLDARAKAWMK
jgi:hypothetical protein